MGYLLRGFQLLWLEHLQNRVYSMYHTTNPPNTSARVDTQPSGRNTGSNLYFIENHSHTQNCYPLVVQRWFQSPARDIHEHVRESIWERKWSNTKIARYTFQSARLPMYLGNSFIIHFTLIPTCSPSISSDVSSEMTHSPNCEALWIATERGSDTISRISRCIWTSTNCVHVLHLD